MKKYRSLEDVYTNIDQPVAPIPSQVINEWTILAADEGLSPIKIGDVDEKFYKRLKKYCKDCENPMRAIRHALEKHPDTPPKTDHCQHCFKKCKTVLHHNHKTGKFVRWSCVNCNSRFVKDTLKEYIEEGRRWYNEKN